MADSPINRNVLTELQDATGPEFAAELITTFLDEAPAMLKDLEQTLADNDADAFRRAAHSLKSNASTFGATALAALARDLEMSGADASALPALRSAYYDAEKSLQAFLNG